MAKLKQTKGNKKPRAQPLLTLEFPDGTTVPARVKHFDVKCDEENNSPEDNDKGIFTIDVTLGLEKY